MTDLLNHHEIGAPEWAETPEPRRQDDRTASADPGPLPLPADHFRITDLQQWIDLCA